jgi:hypothetical protein
MFYRDHNPPHFHAVYADFEAIIDIEKNEIIGGYVFKQGRKVEVSVYKGSKNQKEVKLTSFFV